MEVYKIGCVGTDTVTGKTPRFGTDPITVLATATGRAFQHLGANMQVTAGKSYALTGVVTPTVMQNRLGNIGICYADDAAMTTNRVSLGIMTPPVASGQPNSGVFPAWGVVPATKYVGVYNFGAVNDYCNVYLLGYEY